MTIRAALLLRVSSKDQEKGHSKEFQERDCREWCAARGIEVVAVYDDTKSGDLLIDARPGASGLLADAKKGLFDVVVVWKYDRIVRDDDGLKWFKYELRRAGVTRMESVTDNIPEGPFQSVLLSMTGSHAKQEWEDIRLRSMAGVKARAGAGRLIPSKAPRYGYRWLDPEHKAKTRYEVDSETAWVVARVYREAAEGRPIRAICRGLNDDGIPSPAANSGNSGRWHPPTVRGLLNHPGYKGEAFALTSKHVKDRSTGKVHRRERPEEERVRLPEGTVPALVSPELWQKANDRLARNRAEHNRPDYEATDALLRAGHVYCGNCGNRMVIARQDGETAYYRCQTAYRAPGECIAHAILAADVDAEVWSKVHTIVTRPERLREAWERGRREVAPGDEAAGIAARLAEIERQRKNVGRAIALMDEGDDPDTLVDQLRSLSTEATSLSALRDRISDAEATAAAREQAVEDMVSGLRRLAEEVETWDYRRRRDALSELDLRVAIYPRGHESPWRWVMVAKPPRAGTFPLLAAGPDCQAPPAPTAGRRPRDRARGRLVAGHRADVAPSRRRRDPRPPSPSPPSRPPPRPRRRRWPGTTGLFPQSRR